MAQERRSGHIVPESGVYRVTHPSAHAGAQPEVRLIKGRRFPACPHCQEISFELACLVPGADRSRQNASSECASSKLISWQQGQAGKWRPLINLTSSCAPACADAWVTR